MNPHRKTLVTFRPRDPGARTLAAILMIAASCGLAQYGPPALAADAHWSQVATSGTPPTGNGYVAIYDPVNRRKILFSGSACSNMSCPNSTVWTLALDSGAWSQPTPSGPTPPDRVVPAAIYDPIRTRMVVFGGGFGFTLNDVWELRLPPGGAMTWREIASQGAPSPRSTEAAVYDPPRDRMLLFGGTTDAITYTNEVWALSLSDSTWQLIATAGTPPSPRAGAAGVYDSNSDRLLIFGGYDGTMELDETWELSFSGTPTWTQLSVSGPPPSQPFEKGVVDPVRNRMLVLLAPSQVWALNLVGPPSWSQIVVDGQTPATGVQGPIYDPVGDRVISEADRQGTSFPVPHTTWALGLDLPTPVQIALSGLEASPERVRLSWHAPPGWARSVDLERRTEGAGWKQLAVLSPAGNGELLHEDRDVASGTRYAYRLVDRENGGETITPEVWVLVPSPEPLSLAVRQLPDGNLVVTFVLPTAAPAMLTAYDAGGRRVLGRDVSSGSAGRHGLNLSAGFLAPGVYYLALDQGLTRASARVALIH